MSAAILSKFLETSIVAKERLERLPEPENNKVFSDWILYFERYLGLVTIASKSPENLSNYPLWMANHLQHGPCLVKTSNSLFNINGYPALALQSGTPFLISEKELKVVNDFRVLFEPFVVDEPITTKLVARFTLKPAQGLMRLAIFYQLLGTLTNALFFISNFAILAYVVPSQNLSAYWAIGWLIAGATFTTIMINLLSQRLQVSLDSLAEERAEIVKLSLLWSIRPSYLMSRGIQKVQEMSTKIAEAGRNLSEVVLSIIASLAILPILILMYLRLPGYLFTATIIIAIAAAIPQIFTQLKRHRLQQDLKLSQTTSDLHIYQIMQNLGRLNFYNATPHLLSRWQNKEQQQIEAGRGLSSSSSFESELGTVFKDITQLLAIVAITILIVTAMKNGTEVSVSSAFIIIHLVTQTYMMVPRVTNSIFRLSSIHTDIQRVEDLLLEVEESRAREAPSVTSASVNVFCHKLKLPHGCRFTNQEELTTRFEDSQVVRITGESGSGKSTFLNCLLGLIPPEAGHIDVFGVNPLELSSNERRRIFAYADQSVQLLPGTVRDNLRLFSQPSDTDRTLWEILDQVIMLDRIRALALGLDTPISDARRNFSLGERQRMILAQCLAKRSEILVLDEAMSGLPIEMEGKIFTNIRPFFKQIYFVSHRMHTQDFADKVIPLGLKE